MSYRSIVEMASNVSLRERIAASAAQEGLPGDPIAFAAEHIWALASRADWANAWTFAVDNYTLDSNADTGARPGVISDDMILGAVQPLVAQAIQAQQTAQQAAHAQAAGQ